jgi:hypothetical protein
MLKMEIAHELTCSKGGTRGSRGADLGRAERHLEEELHAKNAWIAVLKVMLQSMQPTEHEPALTPALSLQEKWK